jgi:hypothetical protein
MRKKLHHVGIQGRVSRSTLADANEKRNWRIYFLNFCYCCKNPNLDCNLNLCVGRYHEKEIEARTEPLHNFTDFEFDPF